MAVFAAGGLEGAIGIPFLIGIGALLLLVLLELTLGLWFRRHPFGNIRRVFALVMLRLGQPVLWALAAIGIFAV
ncbi:MAG TPA: hypothetical protein VJ890_18635 [Vineibacter sp.]|nr:hypothetical protein [Vineibacter sp.]